MQRQSGIIGSAKPLLGTDNGSLRHVRMDIYLIGNRVDKRKAESADPFVPFRMQNVKGTNARRKQIVLHKADSTITDRNDSTILVKFQIDVITAAARMADRVRGKLSQKKLDIVRVVARDTHPLQKTERGTPKMSDILHCFRKVKR
jgi:hypothetical protein